MLSGELDWRQYLRPKDTSDLNECRQIDEYNQGVFEFNNAQLPKINELLVKLGYQKYRLDAPFKSLPIARKKYEEMLFNPEFRVIKAVEYLASADPPKYPKRDYELRDGPTLADQVAEEVEKARICSTHNNEIDITVTAGPGHVHNCTCDNKWDGTSERCIGHGVRVRWSRAAGHHFLRPRLEPEVY